MNKTGSIILKSFLALVIVFLIIMVLLSVIRPQQREAEYDQRRDVCGDKLKVIRTLEEAYKTTYGTYCGNFDTLLYGLHQKKMVVRRKEVTAKAPMDSVYDVPEKVAKEKGWIVYIDDTIVPLEKLFEDKKLDESYRDEQKLASLIFLPKFSDKHVGKRFFLKADSIDVSSEGGGKLPTFEAHVELDSLFVDYLESAKSKGFKKLIEKFTGSNSQWLINKKADLKERNANNENFYMGWRVGNLDKITTESNFE